MLKPDDNPPACPEHLARLADAPGEWHVAHTKARNEKALAWELQARGVPYYLPMAKRTQVWGGRRRTVLQPLFPSYVFVCVDAAGRQTALSTKRVCQLLPVPRQDQLLGELEAVRAALHVNGSLDVYPHAAVGRRCRVTRGPMRGVEGVVVQDRDVTRIVMCVSVIGRGAALQISADDLEEAE